jgi:hypothetical protein
VAATSPRTERPGLTLLAGLVVAVGLALAGSAHAGSYAFDEVQMTIDVPEGWDTKATADAVTFTTADGTLTIELTDGGDGIDAAEDAVVTRMSEVVTGVTPTRTVAVLSGRRGYLDAAKGTAAGVSVACLYGVVQTPVAAMTIFVVGQVGRYEIHDADMNRMLHGMTVAPGPGGEIAVEGTISDEAQALVLRVATAINQNDVAGFVATVSAKGLARRGAGGRRHVTKLTALAKSLAAASSLAAYLDVPMSGPWHATASKNAITLTRSDAGAVIDLARIKGAWIVTGAISK